LKLRYFILKCVFFAITGVCNTVSAQTPVKIEGQIYDPETKLDIPQVMIINKRTNVGAFSDNEGKFIIKALQTDTIVLSSLGYKIKKICLKDSLIKTTYYLTIALDKIYFTLKEVNIYPVRSLNEIERDLNKVGIRKTISVEGIDAIQSPITYLYERFSKFGKSKQKVAAWENEDIKRDLLKELFRLYIQYDIIDLNDAEFDAFIKYLNFSDDFMRNSTQLELVLAIKGKYENFKRRWK
jgi:hypothetical protein